MKTTYLLPLALTFVMSSACNSNDDPAPGPDCPSSTPISVKVLEYMPAPGQFVNLAPRYEDSDDAETMCRKATEAINRGDVVTLGAFGGYIIMKLDEPVYTSINDDNMGLRVESNAFITSTDHLGRKYGSCEPGIVMVMEDYNRNGLPDDGKWMEIYGEVSHLGSPVDVAYHNPNDNGDIPYTASDGTEGHIPYLPSYNKQPYYPEWMDSHKLEFSGRRLPDNGYLDEESGQYRLINYTGYVDGMPNKDSELDLSDIRDPETGLNAGIKRIDFIKIYTGVLQVNGALGECSTEVGRVVLFRK